MAYVLESKEQCINYTGIFSSPYIKEKNKIIYTAIMILNGMINLRSMKGLSWNISSVSLIYGKFMIKVV